MGKESKIQWTTSTWNPLWGCEKVSPGCKFCYAERLIKRFGQQFRDVRRTKEPTFYLPYELNKKIDGTEPFTERLVFTCSMSDFFIAQGDPFRSEMWEIIRNTPNLIYQILTKRPERIIDHLPPDWNDGYPNVWLGVSAENQELFNERVSILAQVPAKVRFVSIEPILGPIDLRQIPDLSLKVDWLIVGGESGTKDTSRFALIVWFEELVESAKEFQIPIFIKQLGTKLAKSLNLEDSHGGDLETFPDSLKVRQWPKGYDPEDLP